MRDLITSVKVVDNCWVLTRPSEGRQAAIWVKVAVCSSLRPAIVSSVM